MTEVYPIIAKEELPHVIFLKKEVLESAEKIKARAEILNKAVVQGRNFYRKADLVIATEEGLIMVHANIWEATDINVLLMGGIAIPVCCIREVTFEVLN
ncbi:MAG: hypothetical protein IPO83_15880 [Chitinophagaceae bacterium]|nr:hypothetical protein [Chitinophagaceae bacterium]